MTKKLVIPRIAHPILWLVLSLIITLGIGAWGLLYPDARSSQITINIFVNENSNRVLDLLAQGVEKFFSPVYAIGLTVVIALIVWIFSKSLWTAVGFGLAVAAAWLPVEIFKLLFHENRPDPTQLINIVVPFQADTSFPSGHVSFAIGLAYALLLLVGKGKPKNFLIAVGIVFVMVVAYARVYAGVHFVSDTVGSVFASMIGILIFNQLWPVITRLLTKQKGRRSK